MILKIIVTVLFCVDTFDRVLAASFSNVYFQRGINGVPVVDGPSAQVQQAPLTSVIPLLPITSLVAPCPVPCINPNQPVSNAKLIAFKPISKPSDNDSTNYGYSYVIFDDGTGDKKSQYEISDGGKVRGQYSLVQPDGYVREVQYTADDIKGFRAFVTNLLRGNENNSVEANNITKDATPVVVIEKGNKTLGSEDASKSEPSTPTIDEKSPEQGSSLNNAVGKEEQLAEVKEIKPVQPDPTQEIPVNAAVEEIKPKPNASTNPGPSESNNLNTFGNVIKCIQTSMKNSESPLVYIIFPSTPCI